MGLKDRPITTRVIGSLISAALIGIITTVFGGWQAVFRWARGAWGSVAGWASSAAAWVSHLLISGIPVWVVLVVAVFCFAVCKAWAFLSKLQQPLPPQPKLVREIHYQGMLWRFNRDSVGRITGVFPFCPSCDLQLAPRMEGVFGPTHYSCENCHVHLASYDRSPDALEDLVRREANRQDRAEELRAKI